MSKLVLTAEEKRVIARLRRLASDWPASLWLFVGDGELHVMRCDKDGDQAFCDSGGVDPEYTIAKIGIPSDGGGW
jgi:hypothetical protein